MNAHAGWDKKPPLLGGEPTPEQLKGNLILRDVPRRVSTSSFVQHQTRKARLPSTSGCARQCKQVYIHALWVRVMPVYTFSKKLDPTAYQCLEAWTHV